MSDLTSQLSELFPIETHEFTVELDKVWVDGDLKATISFLTYYEEGGQRHVRDFKQQDLIVLKSSEFDSGVAKIEALLETVSKKSLSDVSFPDDFQA